MILRQYIQEFVSSMRHIILVNVYECAIIIIIYHDKNIQNYSLAFNIVDLGNHKLMNWFFTMLREIIWDIGNLAFVSDLEQYKKMVSMMFIPKHIMVTTSIISKKTWRSSLEN